jgi:hypothetical protein
MAEKTYKGFKVKEIIKENDPNYQHHVVPKQKLKDGSARFQMIGGPYHNYVFRLWPPWDYIKFPSGLRYELSPPLRKNGKWVYVHANGTKDGTEASSDELAEVDGGHFMG